MVVGGGSSGKINNKFDDMVTTHGMFIVNNKGELLLTHPTGHPMNLWSIPKGLSDKGEDSIEAAVREVFEETNIDIHDWFISENFVCYADLGEQLYKTGKKTIHAHIIFVVADMDEVELRCDSTFTVEGSDKEIPENDDTQWKSFEFAEENLHESQKKFMETIKKLSKIFVYDH